MAPQQMAPGQTTGCKRPRTGPWARLLELPSRTRFDASTGANVTFASLTFFLFLPIVFALHWVQRRGSTQNIVLVLASYVFYGWWDYRFCGLMLLSSLVDFGIGLALGACTGDKTRRLWLGLSLAFNLGLLGFFKYFNFFHENLLRLAQAIGWQLNAGTLEIILPVGISFYTFQSLSYSIEVYRRRLEPTRNLIHYLAFVSFFPQLVAGPIERATCLLPQFGARRVFDEQQAREGLRQILWGLAKKLVLADRLAAFVNATYADPTSAGGPALALATVCFAFQIYCDFSAYSDIAIGTARLFGIELSRNFAYPYFAQNPAEFWRRWHISLSTWFRDYVYVPLGGNRTTPWRRAVNVLVTFLLSGLWHGAAWRFLCWGGIHGTAVIAVRASRPQPSAHEDIPGGESMLPSPRVLLRILSTFSIVCFGWIFFRAANMSQAWQIIYRILADAASPAAYNTLLATLNSDPTLRSTLLLLGAFVVLEWIQRKETHALRLTTWPVPFRWAVYSLLIWGGLNLMPTDQVDPFIYFAF